MYGPLLDLSDQNPEGSGAGLLYIFKGSRGYAGMQSRMRTTVLRDPLNVFSPPRALFGEGGSYLAFFGTNAS